MIKFLLDVLNVAKTQWPSMLVYAISLVCVIIWDNRTISRLESELEVAKQEVETYKAIRSADEAALNIYMSIRDKAEQTSKERHNALNSISPDTPDADVVLHCINGLCFKDANPNNPDAASGTTHSLQDAGKVNSSH